MKLQLILKIVAIKELMPINQIQYKQILWVNWKRNVFKIFLRQVTKIMLSNIFLNHYAPILPSLFQATAGCPNPAVPYPPIPYSLPNIPQSFHSFVIRIQYDWNAIILNIKSMNFYSITIDFDFKNAMNSNLAIHIGIWPIYHKVPHFNIFSLIFLVPAVGLNPVGTNPLPYKALLILT